MLRKQVEVKRVKMSSLQIYVPCCIRYWTVNPFRNDGIQNFPPESS